MMSISFSVVQLINSLIKSELTDKIGCEMTLMASLFWFVTEHGVMHVFVTWILIIDKARSKTLYCPIIKDDMALIIAQHRRKAHIYSKNKNTTLVVVDNVVGTHLDFEWMTILNSLLITLSFFQKKILISKRNVTIFGDANNTDPFNSWTCFDILFINFGVMIQTSPFVLIVRFVYVFLHKYSNSVVSKWHVMTSWHGNACLVIFVGNPMVTSGSLCGVTHLPLDKMAAIFGRRYFQMQFHEWQFGILINISLKFVPRGPINNNPASV